jgi:hypothetical protein
MSQPLICVAGHVFDDVTEEDRLLDTIGNGTLYRERTGLPITNTSRMTSRGGDSGGGNGRYRGGGGGGRGGRGGHTGPALARPQYVLNTPDDFLKQNKKLMVDHSTTIRNDLVLDGSRTRQRATHASRMEETMALLRRQPASRQTAPTLTSNHRGYQNASNSGSRNNRQTQNTTPRGQNSGSQSSNVNLQQVVSLADPAAFFAATQPVSEARTVGNSQPSLTSQPPTTVARGLPLPSGRGLSASRWASDPSETNLHPELNVETHPPRSTNVAFARTLPANGKLSQSIWADPTPPTPSETGVLPSPLSQDIPTASVEDSTSTETVMPIDSSLINIRKFTTTAQKGDGPVHKDVVLRLFKVSRLHPVLLEIESKEKKILFCGSTAMNALLEIIENRPHSLTFCNVSPIVTDSIWTIDFLLPQHAQACYQALTRDPFRPALADRSFPRPAPAPILPVPPVNETSAEDVPSSPRERSQTGLNSPCLPDNETLIDLSEDVPEQEDDAPEASALVDLAPLNDDYMVNAVLSGMDSYYDGPFLETLFENVRGSTLAMTARMEEILHSDEHLQISQALACEYFRQSETFTRLNEAEEDKYLNDMAPKLLAKALSCRSSQDVMSVMEYDNTEPLADLEQLKTTNESKANTVPPSGMSVVTESEDVVMQDDLLELFPSQQEQRIGIVYAVDELLSMRDQALNIDRVLLSREEMLPSQKGRSVAATRANTWTAASSIGSSVSSAVLTRQVIDVRGWNSFSERSSSSSHNLTNAYNDNVMSTLDEPPTTSTVADGPGQPGRGRGSQGPQNPMDQELSSMPPAHSSSALPVSSMGFVTESRPPGLDTQERVQSPPDTPTNPHFLRLARSFEELYLDSDVDPDFSNNPGLGASRWATASTLNFPPTTAALIEVTGQINPLSNANSSALPWAMQESMPYHTFQSRADMLHQRQSSNESSELEAFTPALNHGDIQTSLQNRLNKSLLRVRN